MSPLVKPKGEKFTIPSKYILLLCSALCIALLIVTYTTSAFGNAVAQIAGVVVVPFQEGIGHVGTYFGNLEDRFRDTSELLEENKALKEQLDALTTENINLQQDKFELSTLRSLYELDEEYSQYQTVGARVIAKDAGNWYHSFVINKGTEDGLMVDMNVIAGSGLVGRIVTVGSNWAKVSSIISDNSSVSGMVLSTSDNLIVDGGLENYAEGVIEFSKLSDKNDVVVEGDKIVTSHISDKYLPGILIGYISTLNTDSNNLTKSGYLTPAVDFTHLNEVLVIKQLKQTVEEGKDG